MAKRVLQGDRSPEALEWQRQNRQTMPKRAKFMDGIVKQEGEINQAMQQNKQTLLDGIDSLISELNTGNVSYNVNPAHDMLHTIRTGVDLLVPGSTTQAAANITLPQAFRLQNIVRIATLSNHLQQQKPANSQSQSGGNSNGTMPRGGNTFNKTAVDSIPSMGPPPFIPTVESAKLRPPYQGPLRSGDNAVAADKNDFPSGPFVTPIEPDLGKIPGKNVVDGAKLPTTFTTPRHEQDKTDGILGGSTGIPDSAKPSPFITPMYDGEKFQEMYKEGHTVKGRMKEAKLPNEGKIRYVPPENYNASTPLKRGPQNGYLDKFDNEWIKGPSRTPGELFEWDVQLSDKGKNDFGWASRDGKHINVSLKGELTHR